LIVCFLYRRNKIRSTSQKRTTEGYKTAIGVINGKASIHTTKLELSNIQKDNDSDDGSLYDLEKVG